MRLSKGFAAMVALGLSGCSLFGFDRREAVAYQTLFDDSGLINKSAYSAAIAAKFPPGTSVEVLRSYVRANSGECHSREGGKLWCEIAYRAQLCAAAMIGIEVATRDNIIKSTKVEIGGLSC